MKALRTVLDALPVADQSEIARHAAKWEICREAHDGASSTYRRPTTVQGKRDENVDTVNRDSRRDGNKDRQPGQ
jgi:hypothetical protein